MRDEGLTKKDAARHPLNERTSVPHASLLPHGASLMAHPFLPLCPGCLRGASSEDGPDGIGISATLRHQKEGPDGIGIFDIEGEKKA